MFPAVLLAVSLVESALLVKLSCENKGYASAAVRAFYHRENLRHGPMSIKGIRAMIKRFEETGKLGVQPRRDRKRITPVLDAIKTAIDA
ncbi:hypothetical protein TNCT_497651 [Trichonephila clavata]|uniref:DUF4817 domain-containing protein n=1 Tax=Trichonephila clavata TaxID=2740835 RepID=A0A8X6J5P8_TRICU|nr:hypothetical protein TNCT_497651 [Trichonephila clavata]